MTATETDPLSGAFSAEWLMDQQFPPIQYAVEGIIPEGTVVIVAPPKLGKSWLVLDVALNVSVGGFALGSVTVERRPVLYAALEDGPRRLQSRLRILGCALGSADLEFLTELTANPVETILAYLERRGSERPLIIIDTLQKIRPVYSGSDQYGHDYSQLGQLKAAADSTPGASLVLVHHTRKSKGDGGDFVESVSGTQGIAGAADTIITLTRDRHDGAGTLNVTSRDAAEGQYAVNFAEGRWTLEGSTLAEAAQAVQQREATDGVGDDMSTIVGVVYQHPDGIKRGDLILEAGLPASVVDVCLTRAVKAQRIARAGRGLYTPVRSESSARFGEESASDLADLTHLSGGLDDHCGAEPNWTGRIVKLDKARGGIDS
ncbi:AAA family ATPase [Nesterenkonia suensis]